MTSYRLLTALVFFGSFACGERTLSPPGHDASAGQGGAAGSAGTGSGGSGATGGTTGSAGAGGDGSDATGTSGSAGRGGSDGGGGTAGVGTTGGAAGSAGSESKGGSAGSGTAGSGAAGRGGFDGGPFDAYDDVRDISSDSPVGCDPAKLHPITFRLTRSDTLNYCVNVCNGNWLQILPGDGGQPIRIFNPCPMGCGDAICPPDVPLSPAGHTYAWDGHVWGAFGTAICDAEIWCAGPVCMPRGHYIARMCAWRVNAEAGTCTGGPSTPACVDVPFDYPSTSGVVEGVIP